MTKPLIAAFALSLAGCTFGGEVLAHAPRRDGGSFPRVDGGTGFSAGRCASGPTTTTWAELFAPSAPHRVDGELDVGEWDGVEPLEGLYTDVYLDVRDGFLYVLNDWRANTEGITSSCFNLFALTIEGRQVELKVYQDGTLEMNGASLSGEGAYGFGPSPRWPTPHTIYEFRIPVGEGTVNVCCLDPTTRIACSELAREPMVFSIVSGPDGTRSRRSQGNPVRRLGVGAECGNREGVCEDGLTCSALRCELAAPSDGGMPDAGTPDAGADAGEFM